MAKERLKSTVKKPKTKHTKAKAKSIYNDPRSIIDYLPVVEYLPESQSFLLDDGISVMKVFDAIPFATEGRSHEYLQAIANQIQSAFQDVFDEHQKGYEWLVFTYAYYEDNLDLAINQLKNYPKKDIKDTEFTQTYLRMYEQHMKGMCKEGGIFEDDIITDSPFRGNTARCKVCIYRRVPKKQYSAGQTPEDDLNKNCKKFVDSMKNAGVMLEVVNGKSWFDWMLQWFNPSPQVTRGDKQKLRELAGFDENEELPVSDDLSESYFFETPRSSLKHKCWVFDGKPHRFLRVHKIRKPPKIGCMTGEIKRIEESKKSFSLLDKLPAGSIVVSGIVITAQDDIERHINKISAKAKGESTDAQYAKIDCEIAKGILAKRHKLFRGMMGIYLRADNLKQLRDYSIEASNQLLTCGLQPIIEENEMLSLDSYLFHLPGVYEPALDKRYAATRPMWSQHLVNLSGFFGRNTGTGNPGLSFFNRGGGTFSVDPFSLKDRAKNAHLVLNGPTGSGKSATLTAIAAHVLAMYRPRMTMLELGNSFGLLGDFAKSNGLSVNKIQITPENAAAGLVNLAPFVDAGKLIEEDELALLGSPIQSDTPFFDDAVLPKTVEIDGEVVNTSELSLEQQEEIRARQGLNTLSNEISEQGSPEAQRLKEQGNQEEASEQRDIMGECEIIATLMITGGEPEETKKLTRADRRMIRDAILNGARIAVKADRRTTVSDVCEGFKAISLDESIPEKRRERAYDMGQAMRMFTDGFEGDLFDGEGTAFPDADLTIIDVATLGREGYGTQLAIAYSAILMHVNNVAEKNQHSGRFNLMLTDEAHIVLKNPLLSAFLVTIIKTWRKISAWFWSASQNVKDYPDQAAKILNMVEWFFMLVMPADEVNDLDRFRPVTPAQKSLMLSASKAHRKYTEGVLLSDRVEALVRMVPPSLMLSLAGTEGDEKTERMNYMKQFGITEVEAAIYVAKIIDFHRGLRTEMPPEPAPNPKYQKRTSNSAKKGDYKQELGELLGAKPQHLAKQLADEKLVNKVSK